MIIAFHNPQIDIRGTCVAIYDYAYYNEEILKNHSIIVSNKIADVSAFKKFSDRFKVFIYTDRENLHNILKREGVNVFYAIKYGTRDGLEFNDIKTVVHCVFDLSEPHGVVYASISNALAKKYGQFPVVPHMISLRPSYDKNNLRKILRIPEDSIVFGRYGGEDTFNLSFCHSVISDIVKERRDIYFIFSNTPQFCESHPQIIFLPQLIYPEDKNRFICTCDAYLECGTLGHSFGLAIGEFSVNNKPIIAYNSPSLWNTAHLEILGDKGIYFRDEKEFRNILISFDPKKYTNRDNNCYRDYNPCKVMNIFREVFLRK